MGGKKRRGEGKVALSHVGRRGKGGRAPPTSCRGRGRGGRGRAKQKEKGAFFPPSGRKGKGALGALASSKRGGAQKNGKKGTED